LGGELRRQPKDRPARARTTLSGPPSSPGGVAVAAGGWSERPAQSSKVEFYSTWPAKLARWTTADFARSQLADSRDLLGSGAAAIYFARCGRPKRPYRRTLSMGNGPLAILGFAVRLRLG